MRHTYKATITGCDDHGGYLAELVVTSTSVEHSGLRSRRSSSTSRFSVCFFDGKWLNHEFRKISHGEIVDELNRAVLEYRISAVFPSFPIHRGEAEVVGGGEP